jgi:hypothetical protein
VCAAKFARDEFQGESGRVFPDHMAQALTTWRDYSTGTSLRVLLPDRATACRIIKRMRELVFEVTQESDGGYCAECLILVPNRNWQAVANSR